MRVLLVFLYLFAAPVHAFPVQRCINLGNGLDAPAEGDWGYVIERGHLSAIAAAGFDTIRLPVRFSAHWNGRIEPSFLARVDEVIGWAREDGLRVILDLHHFEELMQNPDAYSDTFLSIWKKLSAHYRDASEELIFELLNEPTGSLTTEKAVALFSTAMPIIRTENPDRWVIISGGDWSDEAELAALPVFDDRTVHTFHFYKPWEFTHQQAEWIANPPPPSTWGTEEDRRDVLNLLQIGLGHDAAPVFLGEFGVYDAAPDEDARAWLELVRSSAEEAGVGWCVWSFSSTFRTYDTQTESWIGHRLEALIPTR